MNRVIFVTKSNCDLLFVFADLHNTKILPILVCTLTSSCSTLLPLTTLLLLNKPPLMPKYSSSNNNNHKEFLNRVANNKTKVNKAANRVPTVNKETSNSKPVVLASTKVALRPTPRTVVLTLKPVANKDR